MIGIVVVSHSRALAQAAVALATEMVEASDLPHVVVAAGLNETTFGTDAAAIAEAIGEADSEDGVLVLLDLGSAILSAEMALDFIDPDVAARVELTSAAMVEGLVAAVVTASTGAGLSAVKAEAERGLQAKQGHLDDASSGDAAADTSHSDAATEGSLAADAATRQVRIKIPHGLHARPAARFVACVNRFAGTRVRLRNLDGADREADASSLSAVASLGVRQGDRVRIAAEGDHAEAVLEALAALAEGDFSDDAAQGEPPQTPAAQALAAPGDGDLSPDAPVMGSGLEAAIGMVLRLDEAVDAADYEGSGELSTEEERLGGAIATAITELEEIAATTKDQVGPAEAEVFEAHVALLQDSALTKPAYAEIAEGVPAALAWQRAGEAVAEDFARLSDEYQRERAQDVRSVTNRVLRQLIHGGQAGLPEGAEGDQRILVVRELDPGTAARVDAEEIAGIVTIGGGSTGHGVLIASARGIPVLPGVPDAAQYADGTLVAFDVRDRRVIVDPSDAQRADFEQMLQDRATQQDLDRAAAAMPGQTKDGSSISVKANVT
ncbi:MAG: dihydroxyacetone kinase phosphoryl donor subunit DhaM, partial [Ornithinimicrobium sp.]